ncbi:MAG: discoidin domain-containing protein [Gemmataceae bacterium]
MPISIRCDDCGCRTSVPDDQAGQPMSCGDCEAQLTVPKATVKRRVAEELADGPGEVSARVARAKARRERDLPREPRKSKPSTKGGTGLIMAIVLFFFIGSLGLVGLLGVWIFTTTSKETDNPQAQQIGPQDKKMAFPAAQPRDLRFEQRKVGVQIPNPAPQNPLVFDPPPVANPNPFGQQMQATRQRGVGSRRGLFAKFHETVEVECDSMWQGQWGINSAFDGIDTTSWFSLGRGGPVKGGPTNPSWLVVRFPEDVTVTKVTVKGIRETGWREGYNIHQAKFEFFNDDNEKIQTEMILSDRVHHDFVLTLQNPLNKVRSVRFVVERADGDLQNVGVGEFIIE